MDNEQPATGETPASSASPPSPQRPHFAVDTDAPVRVVLVHGTPDRSRSFNAAVRALPEYAVTTYDRRGFGQRAGDPPPPTGDIFEHAEDLIALLEQTPAVVVGHSFGGIVAMAASIKAPELIPAIGVWEPPLVWTSWWPDNHMQEATAWLAASRHVFKLGELYTRAAMGEAAWQALTPAQRSRYRSEGPSLQEDMRSILHEPFALDSVPLPMLVGCGSGDRGGYDHVARRLASFLSVELFDVPGAPHFVHRAQPETFAEFVRRSVALAA